MSDSFEPTPLRGLRLGVASAPTQIEGSLPPSNWTDWAARGRICDATSPNPGSDHWNRWREDTELMADLGIRDYRLGIDWARIEPEPGRYDHAALDRYREEIGLLRERGISPLVTLHHFSNPWWLEQAGGWERADTASTYLRFVDVVVRTLGDLVDEWITFNEPNVYVYYGWIAGLWPPGKRMRIPTGLALYRHMGAAHRQAYELIHRRQPDARVGIAHHMRGFMPRDPASITDRAAARLSESCFTTLAFHAFHGDGRDPRADFVGVNYYTRSRSHWGRCDATSLPQTDLGWEIYPAGLADACRWVHDRLPTLPIWITENGVCDAQDSFRARYICDHLVTVLRSELPVERYYHWCFVDNWEWVEGRTAPFGLVELDWETQRRTPRLSARFYTDVMAAGEITQQIYDTYVAPQEYPHS